MQGAAGGDVDEVVDGGEGVGEALDGTPVCAAELTWMGSVMKPARA